MGTDLCCQETIPNPQAFHFSRDNAGPHSKLSFCYSGSFHCRFDPLRAAFRRLEREANEEHLTEHLTDLTLVGIKNRDERTLKNKNLLLTSSDEAMHKQNTNRKAAAATFRSRISDQPAVLPSGERVCCVF